MMPEELPNCLCEVQDWKGHGGSLGGLAQSNFKCGSCGRFAMHVSGRGGNILLMVREPKGNLSDKVTDWLNGSILALWRDNYDKFDADMKATEALIEPDVDHNTRNKAAMKLVDNDHGGPLATKVFPLLAGGISEGYMGTLLYALLQTMGQWRLDWRKRVSDPNSKWGMMDAPDAIDRAVVLRRLAETGKYEVSRHATEILEKFEEFKETKRFCDYRTGAPNPPIPPKIPGEEVAVWIRKWDGKEATWEHIDPDRTQELVVPPDPIRVRHDALFGEIFEETGLGSSPRVEIPNRYYGDKFKNEPWYEMKVNGFTLVIGPRKRVISVTLSRDEPFPVTSLRELGERDGVTYTADGGWKSDLKEATSANLHAWGKKKSVEYVKAMLEIAKP